MNTQPRTASASFVFPATVVAALALAIAIGVGVSYYDRRSDSDSDRAFLSPSGPGTIPTQAELNAAAIAEHEAHMEAIYGPYTPPAASASQLESAVLDHDNQITGVGGMAPPAVVTGPESAIVVTTAEPTFDELMALALADYWNLVAGFPPSAPPPSSAQPSDTLDQLMQQALYSYESWAAAYVQAD